MIHAASSFHDWQPLGASESECSPASPRCKSDALSPAGPRAEAGD